jgi:hypothetical protein
MSIECHQVSRQAEFEGLSLPHQFYSPFLGVAKQVKGCREEHNEKARKSKKHQVR